MVSQTAININMQKVHTEVFLRSSTTEDNLPKIVYIHSNCSTATLSYTVFLAPAIMPVELLLYPFTVLLV